MTNNQEAEKLEAMAADLVSQTCRDPGMWAVAKGVSDQLKQLAAEKRKAEEGHLAAQKREGETDEWRDTLALAAETLEVECEHQAEGGHDLECASMKRAAKMIRFVLQLPNQDREVPP